MPLSEDPAYVQALSLLAQCTTPYGLLASPVEDANYRRVWARDGVICGIAGLAAGDRALTNALAVTLETLGSNQGPQGQIPSNVQLDLNGRPLAVSFGGLCGRVDTLAWYLIGHALLGLAGQDKSWLETWRPVVDRAWRLLPAWEFNGRGLLYVPMSGHWADEYLLHGYVLYDQLLRLWASRLLDQLYPGQGFELPGLASLIQANYDLTEGAEEGLTYHPHARDLARRKAAKPLPFLAAAFSPGGYQVYFDLFAHALAFGQGIFASGSPAHTVRYVQSLTKNAPLGLAPAFWPVIQPEDPDWGWLEANHKYHFRNQPFEFQNGGLWPVLNGWWALALASAGYPDQAGEFYAGIARSVLLTDSSSGFFEFMHGQTGAPMGAVRLGWSAAAVVIAAKAIAGWRPAGWLAAAPDLTPITR